MIMTGTMVRGLEELEDSVKLRDCCGRVLEYEAFTDESQEA